MTEQSRSTQDNMDKNTDNSQIILERKHRMEENLAWIELENTIDRTPPKFIPSKKEKKKNIFLSLSAFLP